MIRFNLQIVLLITCSLFVVLRLVQDWTSVIFRHLQIGVYTLNNEQNLKACFAVLRIVCHNGIVEKYQSNFDTVGYGRSFDCWAGSAIEIIF